eukprot:7377819-Prymnesium_polylepis.2
MSLRCTAWLKGFQQHSSYREDRVGQVGSTGRCPKGKSTLQAGGDNEAGRLQSVLPRASEWGAAEFEPSDAYARSCTLWAGLRRRLVVPKNARGATVRQVVFKGTQRDLCDSPADETGRAWLSRLVACIGRREPPPRYRRQREVAGTTGAHHICTFRSSVQPERSRRRDEAPALDVQAPAGHACRIALHATVKQLHVPAGAAEDGAAPAGNVRAEQGVLDRSICTKRDVQCGAGNGPVMHKSATGCVQRAARHSDRASRVVQKCARLEDHCSTSNFKRAAAALSVDAIEGDVFQDEFSGHE